MAIEDYIPDFFGGGMPSYLPGLLGEQETAALQKRANVQGLLGAAITLAGGMAPYGPRRTAAQNILGALAGGFQAGQGAYQGATQNLMMQQQIADAALKRQQAQMKIQGLQEFQKQYPNLYPIAAIDEATAAKAASEQVLMDPIMKALSRAGGDQQTQQQAQLNPNMPVMPESGQVEFITNPETGEKPLPQIDVNAKGLDPEISNLIRNKDVLMRRNQELAAIPTDRAQSIIKNNLEQIKEIDNQISRATTSVYDLSTLYNVVPKEYHARISNLEGSVLSGALTADQFTTKVDNILKDANIDTTDIKNYKFAQQGGYEGSFVDYRAAGVPKTTTNVYTGDLSKGTAGKVEEGVLSDAAAITRLNSIKFGYRPEYQNIRFRTGQAWASLKDKFGALPEVEKAQLAAYSQYRQNALQNLNQTIKDLTGAAMGEQEAGRIIASLPNAGQDIWGGDSPTEFEAKLNNAVQQTMYALARKNYALKKGLKWENTPLTDMPSIVNKRGEEIAKQYKLDPTKPADQQTIMRQLAAEFGIAF